MKAEEWNKCTTQRRGKEFWTGEGHCMDVNVSDGSDQLVSLVTAWASFVKLGAG